MEYRLSKLKSSKLEIVKYLVEFDDTFSSIHIRDFYLNKYNLTPPCIITKADSPDVFKELNDLITNVNLFKDRDEVPNKRVKTDRPGTSKLIRSKDKSKIEICYRVKKKSGEYESMATSNNTCYIDIETRERFFRDSKLVGPHRDVYGKDHYIIRYGDPKFKYWSEFMDREYSRLAGIKYQKRAKPDRPEYTGQWKSRANDCLSAYQFSDLGSDMSILEDLSSLGFCRINLKKTSLYDKNGNDFEKAGILDSVRSKFLDGATILEIKTDSKG